MLNVKYFIGAIFGKNQVCYLSLFIFPPKNAAFSWFSSQNQKISELCNQNDDNLANNHDDNDDNNDAYFLVSILFSFPQFLTEFLKITYFSKFKID